MTPHPDIRVTDPARRVWCDAGDQLSTVREKTRLIREGDQTLDRAIRDAYEMPTIEALHAQASLASDLIEAAQQYRRELLKMLALAGGYDQPERKEAA